MNYWRSQFGFYIAIRILYRRLDSISPFRFYIAVRILYRRLDSISRSDSVPLRTHVFEWMARLAAAQADFHNRARASYQKE